MKRETFLAGLGLVFMSGCFSMNPITAIQLARLDPMEADPASMAVQIILPDGIGVIDGSPHLSLNADHESGEAIAGEYPLMPAPNDVWRVASDVQDQFRADQARAMAWETADPDAVSGSFGASFGVCTLGDGPASDARFSLSLQLEPGAAFLPLYEDARVSDLYDVDDVDALQPCA